MISTCDFQQFYKGVSPSVLRDNRGFTMANLIDRGFDEWYQSLHDPSPILSPPLLTIVSFVFFFYVFPVFGH